MKINMNDVVFHVCLRKMQYQKQKYYLFLQISGMFHLLQISMPLQILYIGLDTGSPYLIIHCDIL